MLCPTGRVKDPTLPVCTLKHGLENRNAEGVGFGVLFLTSNPVLHPQDHQICRTRCCMCMVIWIFSISADYTS